MATWILQANPALYDISAALQTKPIIYWRIPQYTDQVDTGDRVLMWRAGKQAGFVGWGVLLAKPNHYDLSQDTDPHIKGALPHAESYAPVRVWPATELPKDVVSALIPGHRIVTAPMGTVFPVTAEDLAALQDELAARHYDLAREPEPGFSPLPVFPAAEPEPKSEAASPTRAKITPAMFLLSSSPDQPVEITIEGDSLRMQLVERDALKALDDSWDAVGIYFLIGTASTGGAALSVYVGKAQGLRGRIKAGHAAKEWTRCLLVQREGLHAFNASDISWLERRLIDVLLEAPSIDLVNKTPPPPEAIPDYKAEILERTVVATLGVLAVLGAHIA